MYPLIIIFTIVTVIFAFNDTILPEDECIPWWNYRGDRGQDHWCCKGNHDCCGENQSPINIDVRHSTYDNQSLCLTLVNYDCTPQAMALHNTGRTVELHYNAYNSTTIPHVIQGPVSNGSRFDLERIIFHWGRNSSYGSEHTLDNNRLPLEMQMIHRNTKYATNKEALKHKDGFLIISVLFILTHKDNDQLRDLIYNLHRVTWLDKTYCMKPFSFLKLLPPSFGYYYTYNGSLPFPPCTENTMWIVFHNPVPISEYQLNEFRRLQERTEQACPKRNCPIVDNYRKTACIKKRVVKWKEECPPNPKC